MWINIDLKKIVGLFVILFLPMWLITALVTWINDEPTYEVKYDCRQATIRIDYPIEVKEKCKKLMKKYNEVTKNSQLN